MFMTYVNVRKACTRYIRLKLASNRYGNNIIWYFIGAEFVAYVVATLIF